jgi:hypothetical protein
LGIYKVGDDILLQNRLNIEDDMAGNDYQTINEPNQSCTERSKELTVQLNYRIHLEEIVRESSISLMTVDGTIDKKIEAILKRLGEFAKTNRSYIFLFSSDGRFMSNTHE